MSRVFDGVPVEGSRLRWSDQDYEVTRLVTLTIAGERVWQATLSSVCAECGNGFAPTAGDAAKFLRKRCTACDPKGELDKLERKTWVNRGRAERMRAAKAAKTAAKTAEKAAGLGIVPDAPVSAQVADERDAADRALEAQATAAMRRSGARCVQAIDGEADFSDGTWLAYDFDDAGRVVALRPSDAEPGAWDADTLALYADAIALRLVAAYPTEENVTAESLF